MEIPNKKWKSQEERKGTPEFFVKQHGQLFTFHSTQSEQPTIDRMPSDGAETSPITVESQALNRVLAYSAVKGAIDNAKTYYSAAKDYSPVVKSFSDSIEVRLGETARIVTPTVQKVFSQPSFFFSRLLHPYHRSWCTRSEMRK